MKSISFNRSLMKANYDSWNSSTASDQANGIKPPALQKSPKENAQIITLPESIQIDMKLQDALLNRRSVRQYSDAPLSLNELSYLLETTCRVQKIVGDSIATLRPAPSGGARHPFETYLVVTNVTGLENGNYHYLPLSHQLERLSDLHSAEQIIESVNGQKFVDNACVSFYFSAVPYRAEWRYGLKSHKVMLIDLGHLGQNLYLAAEGIHAGTCAIASYDQEKADALFELDGVEEFIVYIMPVGKKNS